MREGRSATAWFAALVGATVVSVCSAVFAFPAHTMVIVAVGLAVLGAEALWALRMTRRATPDAVGVSVRRLGQFSLSAALVAFAFATTAALEQVLLEPIEARSDAIALNALPSMTHLAASRDALTRLQSALRTYLLAERGDAARAAARADIETAAGDLDTELAAYRALPPFPGERRLAQDVEHALALLHEHVGEALGEKAPPPSLEARVAKVEDVLPYVERTDRALFRVQLLNIEQGKAQASEILALKSRSKKTAFALSGLSLVAAVIAVLLARTMARRQERAASLYEELLVARAAELEAFAGRVAHELKEPLGALSLRLSVMQMGDGIDRAHLADHVDKAVRQVDRMNHTLEALLEFARAGANPPPGAHAELHEVLDEVVTELRPELQTANATLEVDAFSPLEVACTPAALNSVLTNLLGNAVKFVREGKRSKRDVLVRVDDRDERVRVEVHDTGPGLPLDSQQRVFLPFVRVGETSQSGTGIGLATVKRLVEAYGGQVGVRSVVGQGSVFWFEMPRAEAHV